MERLLPDYHARGSENQTVTLPGKRLSSHKTFALARRSPHVPQAVDRIQANPSNRMKVRAGARLVTKPFSGASGSA
jgi:hypothetical protein